MACLLLLCVGLMVPAAGQGAHLCLSSFFAPAAETGCCGDDCGKPGHEKLPCCIDLEELPEAQAPVPPPELPEIPVVDLGWRPSFEPAVHVAAGIARERAERIRGPTSHHTRRAELAVWRL